MPSLSLSPSAAKNKCSYEPHRLQSSCSPGVGGVGGRLLVHGPGKYRHSRPLMGLRCSNVLRPSACAALILNPTSGQRSSQQHHQLRCWGSVTALQQSPYPECHIDQAAPCPFSPRSGLSCLHLRLGWRSYRSIITKLGVEERQHPTIVKSSLLNPALACLLIQRR